MNDLMIAFITTTVAFFLACIVTILGYRALIVQDCERIGATMLGDVKITCTVERKK